jgi:hypothetical protein
LVYGDALPDCHAQNNSTLIPPQQHQPSTFRQLILTQSQILIIWRPFSTAAFALVLYHGKFHSLWLRYSLFRYSYSSLVHMPLVQIVPHFVLKKDHFEVRIEAADSAGNEVGCEGYQPEVEVMHILEDGLDARKLVVPKQIKEIIHKI